MSVSIEKKKGPATLTAEQLSVMADEHINHYNNLIKMSVTNTYVRVGECSSLIRIWEGVKAAVANGLTYNDLKPEMRSEILDAYYDSIS